MFEPSLCYKISISSYIEPYEQGVWIQLARIAIESNKQAFQGVNSFVCEQILHRLFTSCLG